MKEAVTDASYGANAQGTWQPQLLAAEKATKLVTVGLGANDMDFSDDKYWLGQCVGAKLTTFFGRPAAAPTVRSNCAEAARARATSPQTRGNLDAMFARLDKARANGARVVVVLYYNAINPVRNVRLQPDRSCALLHGISARIVDAINVELAARSRARGFTTIDLRPVFAGHGAGSSDSYVVGTECEAVGVAGGVDFDLGWPAVNGIKTEKNIQIRFDSHPNAKGTRGPARSGGPATRGRGRVADRRESRVPFRGEGQGHHLRRRGRRRRSRAAGRTGSCGGGSAQSRLRRGPLRRGRCDGCRR